MSHFGGEYFLGYLRKNNSLIKKFKMMKTVYKNIKIKKVH
jgi:hypothetical protein